MFAKQNKARNPLELPARRRRQSGFIVTIELILITTVLIIGSLAGVIAIRDALIKHYANKQSQQLAVYDANGSLLGEAMGLDEHEAVLVPYIDRSVDPQSPDPAHRNYRAMIGVRDDRFTSREPVYYDSENCTGTPCIKAPSDEASDSAGVDGIGATGAVGYLYALQGGPTYAVGSSAEGVQGRLYRQAPEVCPAPLENVRSRYLSQSVVQGRPCQSFLAAGPQPPDASCLANIDDAVCDCGVGYESQGDIISQNRAEIDAIVASVLDNLPGVTPPLPDVSVGTLCCPTGTSLEEDADLSQTVAYVLLDNFFTAVEADYSEVVIKQLQRSIEPLAGTLNCVSSLNLRAAVSVNDPNEPGLNTLDRFVAPFQVNLPIDQTTDSWISTAPDGEG